MKVIEKCFGWLLKKTSKWLNKQTWIITAFALIGAGYVLSQSLVVLWEPVDLILKNKYGKQTVVNPARAKDSEAGQPDEGDIQEIERVVSVPDRIREITDDEGFSEVDKLIRVMNCESSLRYDEIVDGDYKNYSINPKNNSYDRGFVQWSRKYNPHISDECAFSLDCSVKEMIKDVNQWGWGKWNASRSCWE